MAKRATKSEWWSWEHLVDHADKLGIPHFQRGSVWDASSRVALLESLQLRSPCGSMVIWPQPSKTKSTTEIGVPLLEGHAFSVPKYVLWLVDGQQRSRTLLGIYREAVRAEVAFERYRLASRDATTSAWLVALEEMMQSKPALFNLTSVDAEDPSAFDEEEGSDEGIEEVDELPAGRVTAWFISLSRAAGSKLAKECFKDPEAEKARNAAFRLFQFDPGWRGRAPARSGAENRGPQAYSAKFLLPLALLFVDQAERWRGTLASPRLHGFAAKVASQLNDEECAWLDAELPWGVGFVAQRPDLTWAEFRKVAPNASLWALGLFADPKLKATQEALWGLFKAPQFAKAPMPAGSSFDEAVATYVRINRAGVRVTAEERALATLSRYVENLPGKMAAFFALRDLPDEARATAMASWRSEKAQRLSRGVSQQVMNQRAGLRHTAARAFAFDLWMRVVTRFLVLRLLPATGRRWTDMKALEKWSMLAALERHDETPALQPPRGRAGVSLSEVVERATAAVLLVDDIFARELFFDDRMQRPELESTVLVFEYLSAFSTGRLLEIYAARTDRQRIADMLMLATLGWSMNKVAHQGFLNTFRAAPPAAKLDDEHKQGNVGLDADAEKRLARRWIDALAGAPAKKDPAKNDTESSEPHSIVRRQTSVENAFHSQVDQARNLNHRSVRWLYGLQRSLGATEFSWEAQRTEQSHMGLASDSQFRTGACSVRPLVNQVELPDEAGSLKGQRQHLIPYMHGRQFERILGQSGRGGNAEINQIGNLTWLSERQNGFVDGLGSNPAVLTGETPANLRAHFLVPFRADEVESSPTVLARYEAIAAWCGASASERDTDAARDHFQKFAATRERWMKEAMSAWLNEAVARLSAELYPEASRD
jgi:hypothetical protein